MARPRTSRRTSAGERHLRALPARSTGRNPIGDNEDITAVLTGRNALGFAFIPKDCPAIDASGELCDRWGTPYFFHQLSAQEMEIRSAGPDRKMWTDDDEVLSP